MRELQGSGTNMKLIYIVTGIVLLSMVLSLIGSVGNCIYALLAFGFGGYTLVSLFTMAMMFTVRETGFKHYKELPLCFIKLGAVL